MRIHVSFCAKLFTFPCGNPIETKNCKLSTGGPDDPQIQIRRGHKLVLPVSDHFSRTTQSKYKVLGAQAAFNARAGQYSARMAQAAAGTRPARTDAQTQRLDVAGGFTG